MRVALTHNVRVNDSEDEPEFDDAGAIASIEQSLARAGHVVEPFDVTGPASLLVTRLEAFAPDIVFNLAEGRRGKARRAFYPALFEELGIPSTGSDAYTMVLTLDTALTKRQLTSWGVPSPQGRFITRDTLKHGGLEDFEGPAIVKQNFQGSRRGADQNVVVSTQDGLVDAIDRLLNKYPDGVLVERHVSGVDVRMVYLGGLPQLPGVERVVGAAQQMTLRAPADVGHEATERLQDLAARAVSALGLRDTAVLDFRVGADGKVWFLSANALPSFAPDGALFVATAALGITRQATVLAVLRAGAVRHGLAGLLDATKPRPERARRTSLRVGLAFNMKRIESHGGDDREAEYDAPETIQAVTAAIESHGHVVVPLEATPDFPRALMSSNIDVVFNVAEGMVGRSREAQVPSLCELLDVPYSGSDSATLSICLDKSLAKRLLVGVDTPTFQALVTGRERLRPFRYPVIVKPNQEGTSKGITDKSVCDNERAVRDVARWLIERYGQPALVEEYIFGRELTVGLLGERRPRVLPPMEVVFLNPVERPVYDYQCKQNWQSHVRYECPARLTRDELRAIERACRTTFMALGCRDVARVDLRLTPEGRVFVLEVNPLPGLTPDYSDLCLIANGAKIEYRTLIGDILSGAIKRWQNRQRGRPSASPIAEGPAAGASDEAPNQSTVAPN